MGRRGGSPTAGWTGEEGRLIGEESVKGDIGAGALGEILVQVLEGLARSGVAAADAAAT